MALLAAAFVSDGANLDSFMKTADLSDYRGVARRQDVLFESNELKVIEDFAHHPTAIRLCLESYKNCYPEYECVAVFEPRSNTSATNVLQKEFTESLAFADRVLIAPVHRGEAYTDETRIDSNAMVKSLSTECLSASAYHAKEELFEELASMDSAVKRLVLLFTNGSFGEPLNEYLRVLKSK